MKKCLAALLLVIAVVSVVSVAGVVTTQKAAAVQVMQREGVPYKLPVTGTTVFSGGLCNFHAKGFSSNSKTPAYHAEQSSSNVATARVYSDKAKGKLDGNAQAVVGIPYVLQFSNWNAVKDKKVTISVAYTYDLKSQPSVSISTDAKQGVYAYMYVVTPNTLVKSPIVVHTGHKYAGVERASVDTIVAKLATKPTAGGYHGQVSFVVSSNVGTKAVNAAPTIPTSLGVQSAYASVRVSSVTFTFH